MKNKNNVVLSIIAIATILVTVVGATFAYFASTVNEGTGSNFTAVVEEDNVLFTATGSNMTMEVTADKMTQHASSDGTIVAATAEADAIDVSLTVGTEGSIACYYNIYFQWDSSGTAYLTKTTSASKEFTAQLTLTDTDGTGSSGTNKFASETQLTDVVTTTNKTLVVEGASIVANASNSGAQTWRPTIKFYNLQLNQTDLAGKTFSGKFTIDDVECGAYNETTLSDTILAKVSSSDYISSQDGSVYRLKQEIATGEVDTIDAGVRYEGLDPDNYITFNGGEEWRIIGVFEGSTIGLESGTQYTKIIRNDSISSMAWDSNGTNDWKNATLNTYLNGTYLSSMSDSSKIAKYNENYSKWYLDGAIEWSTKSTIDWLFLERGSYYKAAIGLMYPSDYGYGAYGTDCTTRENIYISDCSDVNWLASFSKNNSSGEWLISKYNPNPEAFYLNIGNVIHTDVTGFHGVRPTLYLEANLTATGSGTKIDPYVLN